MAVPTQSGYPIARSRTGRRCEIGATLALVLRAGG
jgi:hypothetical protein